MFVLVLLSGYRKTHTGTNKHNMALLDIRSTVRGTLQKFMLTSNNAHLIKYNVLILYYNSNVLGWLFNYISSYSISKNIKNKYSGNVGKEKTFNKLNLIIFAQIVLHSDTDRRH